MLEEISKSRPLFNVGNYEFRLVHLLVIGVLILSFTISTLVRIQALDYGFELNEFDPFFNFRATQFIVENGIGEYFGWHDNMSWYPEGRDISSTSQVMLHVTAATLYGVFGAGSDLYDFTIMFPVVFGSLTAIVVFALVRVLAGTTAGLLSALLYSVSLPFIVRGTIGWFKSEPLGMFYSLLGVYLFLSGIKSQNYKIAIAKVVGAGIFMTFGLSAWGGTQFFVIPLGMFFFALPFVRKDAKFTTVMVPVFVASFLLSALAFERPGISFVTGIGGVSLVGSTLFLIACFVIQKLSREERRMKLSALFLIAVVGGGIAVLVINVDSGFIGLPSFRYLNAVNPFLTATDPLVTSVSEHATTTITQSFYFHSVLMIFAGLGVWIIFKNKVDAIGRKMTIHNDMVLFALILGITGVYVSSAFVRLELFASIAVIILASIGISQIIKELFRDDDDVAETTKKGCKQMLQRPKRRVTKLAVVAVIVALLLIPVSLPPNNNWIVAAKGPPTILNGGSNYNVATQDWPQALEWLKENTPEDAVIASWWDYGYWITTLADRTTLADNATISTKRIQDIARMFLSSPEEGWKKLQDMGADYVLVYIAGQKITNEGGEPDLYILNGGGDESKKQWFIRIAEDPLSKYLHQDGMSGTEHFWQNTLLGKMFPFSPIVYANLATNDQSLTFKPGYTPLYVKDIKLDSDNEPLKLVYSSQTFDRKSAGVINGIFIYKVNQNYDPDAVQPQEPQQPELQEAPMQTQEATNAIIKTQHGDITIELRPDVAPKTVENFAKLAESGFYDGLIFHRIVPEFVIQGGDPNTKSGPRDTWGLGDPGYNIGPEFSNLEHTKYTVSMARGKELNTAGSQFFITLDDASWLDRQYTIFGKVVEGTDVVDKIASVETNSQDQPVNPDQATIETIEIIR